MEELFPSQMSYPRQPWQAHVHLSRIPGNVCVPSCCTQYWAGLLLEWKLPQEDKLEGITKGRLTSQFGWDFEKKRTQSQVWTGQSLAVKLQTPMLISAKVHDLVAV